MVCSFSWFSRKKVGCPLRSKQNFFRAGGVGVSAKGKILGSRLAGIGGGLKKSGGYSVEVVVVVVTTVVVVMGASAKVVETG